MRFFIRYFGYIKPYFPLVIVSAIASMINVATSGVGYWMAADLVQALLTNSLTVPPLPVDPFHPSNIAETLKHFSAQFVVAETPIATLQKAIVFILAAFLLKNITYYVQILMSVTVEQRVGRDMRRELYRSLLDKDLSFFHIHKSGDLVSTAVNDINQLNSGLGESFSKLMRDPFTAVLFLLLLFAISWKMTLAALLIAPLSSILVGSIGASLKRKSKRTQQKIGDVTARLNESLYGIRIIQAYSGQEQEKERFRETTSAHFQQALRRERMRRITSPLNEVVGVLVIAAILFVAGGKVVTGEWISPQDFVRFLVMLFGLLTPVVGLGKVHNSLKVAEGAAERVFKILDEESTINDPENPVSISEFSNELRVDHVGLKYSKDRDPALSDISLSISPGDRLFLVGRSGSGKSSLLNMLPRFYDPSEGNILLDGHDLRDLDINSLRNLYGIVTQEIFLFHDTVAANIAYNNTKVTREDVIEAAKAAHAHEFILELPKGYDTQLGDLGERLSGGQRQRISIARALVKDPPILLLDEPTSALDSDVAEEIQYTLDEVGKGRTVITATHRLSSIRVDDRVVLMEAGKIQAEGTHGHLYETNSLYKELCDKQFVVTQE